MLSKSQFVAEMKRVLESRLALTSEHPVFTKLSKSPGDIKLLRIVALQGYQLTKEFARYVAGLLHHCPSLDLRPALATNLYEEETGGLSKTGNHLKLMHDFTTALDISPQQREAAQALPVTRDLIEYRWQLVNDPARFHLGAAAVLVASEGQNLEQPGVPSRAHLLKSIYSLSDKDLKFLTVHATEDVYHVQEGLTIVSEVCVSEQMQREAIEAICLTCHKFRAMYDGILAEYEHPMWN